ncbi:MAG: hypothetical protein HY941_05680 [Gammaproteobacteria bacterium]|nr:hypothetical protein [Gammaproteobacteria bacterium]
MSVRVSMLILVLAGVGTVWAGELLEVGIERVDRRYAVDIDARFNTSAERLRVLLTDYPNLGRINASIQHSEVLETNAPQQHCVRTEAHVCVGFFCKDIVQVQDVGVLADGTILATLRPQGSYFSYGIARWQFWEEPTGARMRFHSEIEPAFWVPPIIGPWLIQRALRAETLKSVANLERLAEAPLEEGGP